MNMNTIHNHHHEISIWLLAFLLLKSELLSHHRRPRTLRVRSAGEPDAPIATAISFQEATHTA